MGITAITNELPDRQRSSTPVQYDIEVAIIKEKHALKKTVPSTSRLDDSSIRHAEDDSNDSKDDEESVDEPTPEDVHDENGQRIPSESPKEETSKHEEDDHDDKERDPSTE